MLRQGNPPLSASQARLADGLVDSVARMGELIRELLRLARMEVNPDSLESVSLGPVVAAARADLASFLDLTGGHVHVDGELPDARGSASLLRELVQNLIENGVKYGDPAGPHVRIASATAPPGRVAVAIEDDGPGVPVNDRERIFRPFVRLDRDRNRDGGGHGLAIAHRIVTAHGGTIRVESGQTLAGARFVVELPGT